MQQLMTVDFRGTELYGTEVDGIVFVPIKPIVDAMGLSWHGQLERAKRDPVILEGIRIIRIPFAKGGPQDAVCLMLRRVNGWLFKINSGRIKDALVRERVQVYQRECADVLATHFLGQHAKHEKERHDRERHNLQLIDQARLIWGAPVGAQLWDKLAMPKVPGMLPLFEQLELFHKKAA